MGSEKPFSFPENKLQFNFDSEFKLKSQCQSELYLDPVVDRICFSLFLVVFLAPPSWFLWTFIGPLFVVEGLVPLTSGRKAKENNSESHTGPPVRGNKSKAGKKRIYTIYII